MMRTLLFLVMSGITSGAFAAPTMPETANVRGLLLSAIDARDGTAEAWLIGPMAEKLKNETKAPPNTRVKVSVSTLQVFRPGCKRLRMLLAMPTHKMKTVNGTTEPFQMYYDLNLCRDGQPPQASSVGTGGAQ
jgi:hypothetical protein